MTYQEEIAMATNFFDDCIEILERKAHDYASSTDAMSNFKAIATMVGIPVEQVFLVFLSVKMARLSELVKTNKPTLNESISDSLHDLANYACLMDCFLKEKSDGEKS